MFFQKPKKKNYAPMIIAIVVGVLAAMATAYIIVTKVLKKPLFKKKAVCECECDCDCDCDELEDALVEEICLDDADEA